MELVGNSALGFGKGGIPRKGSPELALKELSEAGDGGQAPPDGGSLAGV